MARSRRHTTLPLWPRLVPGSGRRVSQPPVANENSVTRRPEPGRTVALVLLASACQGQTVPSPTQDAAAATPGPESAQNRAGSGRSGLERAVTRRGAFAGAVAQSSRAT